MRVTLTSKLVNARVNEQSAFTLIASFFDDTNDTWATSNPTTAKYRIDRIASNPGCALEVVGWTTLTPATSISIQITATNNAILNNYSFCEPRQITVKANDALSTQYEQTYRYDVVNLAGTT